MTTSQLFRPLARARGLSIAAVVMLALGTAALIAAFALVNAMLLREPPFESADRIVAIITTRTESGKAIWRERWSYPRLTLLAALSRSFESVAGYTASTQAFTGFGGPESVAGEIVSTTYFSLLRARPARGRFFAIDEDIGVGAHPVVVLSHDLWQRRYQSDAAIVGKTVTMNGVPFTVIGITAQGFHGISDHAQFWIPTSMAPIVYYPGYMTTDQSFIGVIARMKAGVAIQAANAELAVLGGTINTQKAAEAGSPNETVGAMAVRLNNARVDATARRSVLTLLAGVALLYLLACANVANLLLARATSRHREGAVRIALGCGRAALFRFYITEGAILAIAGSTLGALIAYWIGVLVSLPESYWLNRNPYGNIGAFDAPAFDLHIVAFAIGLTLFTAMLVCAAPAMSVFRSDVQTALRIGARAGAPGSGTLRRPTLRGFVVACEAALAVLLLVTGALMITTFRRIRATDFGVDASHVLTFAIRPSDTQIAAAQAPAYIGRMLDAIKAVPGVVSASVDGGAPANGSASTVLHIVGQPLLSGDQAPGVNRHYVGPDHFQTLGIRLLAGRSIEPTDIAGRAKVVVISDAAAKRFWPGENALGKRVWFSNTGTWGSADSSAEVVGIVNDVLHRPADANPNRSDFYTPYAQFSYGSREYFVRTAGDPVSFIPSIRKALLAAEPNVPMINAQPLHDRIGQSWARHGFDAMLFGAFASIALLLASVGIYSVVSYAISQRTREMGIRMALGAHPMSIVALVIREGMAFPAVGLAMGVILSLLVTPALRAQLYDVAPTDPLIFGAAVALLMSASVLACYMPARRATRINPTDAMRSD